MRRIPGARGAKQVKSIKHVLMIGVETIPNPTSIPTARNGYNLIAARVCSEIEAVNAAQTVCAALLDSALSPNELVRCAQTIRWRWPAARILVVRSEEPRLDDALYDERLEPGLSAELLLASIQRIVDAEQHASEGARLWEC